MTIRLGVVMDPMGSIHYKKDSTLALLQAAAAHGCDLYYFEQKDLFLRDGIPFGEARALQVMADEKRGFHLQAPDRMPLAELDVILMRKDPPVNEEYIYTTYVLDHAERLGVLVMNRPQALRDANEKLFATFFPQCTPPTLVTSCVSQLRAFWQEHGDIICKPLNSMGGTSVFRLPENEVNANVIFATLTQSGTSPIMAQRFIPEIKAGDKRILLIDGEPIPYALARVPQGQDWRGNLAVGAKGIVQALSARDLFICQEVGSFLRERGLYFVGIDVIGDYLTEINVTSPTGIRELEAGVAINIGARFMEKIEQLLKKSSR